MTKIKMILVSSVFVAVLPFSAQAGSYVKLGESKKSSSFQMIGKVKKKKKTELKLGGLRTDDAKLPTGKLSLSGRMKLRAKRALQRQNAMSRAKRRQPETLQNDNDSADRNFDASPSAFNNGPSTPEANIVLE